MFGYTNLSLASFTMRVYSTVFVEIGETILQILTETGQIGLKLSYDWEPGNEESLWVVRTLLRLKSNLVPEIRKSVWSFVQTGTGFFTSFSSYQKLITSLCFALQVQHESVTRANEKVLKNWLTIRTVFSLHFLASSLFFRTV